MIWYFCQKKPAANSPETGGKQTGKRQRTAAPEFNKEKAFYWGKDQIQFYPKELRRKSENVD